MFAVVFVVLALIAVAAWSVGGSGAPKACEADGRNGPNGTVYGRSPEHDCRFVDGDGNELPGR